MKSLFSVLHNIVDEIEKAAKRPFVEFKVKQAYATWATKVKEILVDAHLELQALRKKVANGETDALMKIRDLRLKIKDIEDEVTICADETATMFDRDAEDVERNFKSLMNKLTNLSKAEAPPAAGPQS